MYQDVMLRDHFAALKFLLGLDAFGEYIVASKKSRLELAPLRQRVAEGIPVFFLNRRLRCAEGPVEMSDHY